MPYLADTNVITRRVLPADALYPVVHTAIDRLMRRGETIHITPQNLVEFRALATRPVEANGLGLTPEEASTRAQRLEAIFTLLPETPDIYPHWRRLADHYRVVGRQVFDTRLVAVMLAYGITHLLTFDTPHFRRFAEITVVHPQDVDEREADGE